MVMGVVVVILIIVAIIVAKGVSNSKKTKSAEEDVKVLQADADANTPQEQKDLERRNKTEEVYAPFSFECADCLYFAGDSRNFCERAYCVYEREVRTGTFHAVVTFGMNIGRCDYFIARTTNCGWCAYYGCCCRRTPATAVTPACAYFIDKDK
jgi:hypothetical protein